MKIHNWTNKDELNKSYTKKQSVYGYTPPVCTVKVSRDSTNRWNASLNHAL